jgi:hypothetical protein
LRLEEFEHVLGAAAEAIGQDDFVVIGSQAILGRFGPEDKRGHMRPKTVAVCCKIAEKNRADAGIETPNPFITKTA